MGQLFASLVHIHQHKIGKPREKSIPLTTLFILYQSMHLYHLPFGIMLCKWQHIFSIFFQVNNQPINHLSRFFIKRTILTFIFGYLGVYAIHFHILSRITSQIILLTASRLFTSVSLLKRTTYMWQEKLLWCFVMLCLEVSLVWFQSIN